MKALPVIICLILATLTCVYALAENAAQPPAGGSGAPGAGLQQGHQQGGGHGQNLALTPEQRARVKALREEIKAKLQEAGITREAVQKVRSELQALMKENPKDVEAIRAKREELQKMLAPVQDLLKELHTIVGQSIPKDQLEKMKEKRHGQDGRGKHGAGTAPGTPATAGQE